MSDPVPKDEAGPLWLLLEDFLESWPVKPKWVLLAGLIVVLILAVAYYVYGRPNQPRRNVQADES